MIVVFVMNRELLQPLSFELASAASADRRKDLECLFPVAPHPNLLLAPNVCNKLSVCVRPCFAL